MAKQWVWAASAALGLGCAVDPLGTSPQTVTEVPCVAEEVAQEVRIVDFAFEPSVVAIEDGQVVRWTNEGAVEHSVTSGVPNAPSAGAIFDADLEAGDTWCARFEGVGKAEYHCAYHPTQMRGAVVDVTAASEGPGGGAEPPVGVGGPTPD